MASTYRVTMTDTKGVETVLTGLTQDGVDELIDTHESRNSAYPVGVVEREKKDGTLAANGGWDVRPREVVSTPIRTSYAAERNAEMEAVARVNDANDRREERRAYYLRTGR